MKRVMIRLLAFLGFCMGCQAQEQITMLTPEEYDKAVKADTAAVILDVRQPSEYAEGHLEGALSLDVLDTQAFEQGMASLDKSKHYYLYCRSGRRSHQAALLMKENGFQVADMKGGILAWSKAGLPLCTEEEGSK